MIQEIYILKLFNTNSNRHTKQANNNNLHGLQYIKCDFVANGYTFSFVLYYLPTLIDFLN